MGSLSHITFYALPYLPILLVIMQVFKRKLHRTIERGFKLKKNSLKQPFETLKEKYRFTEGDILRVSNECATYCIENNTDYVVSFNFYVSCLNNPKKYEGGTVQ
jgi:hypothetical protein